MIAHTALTRRLTRIAVAISIHEISEIKQSADPAYRSQRDLR